MSPTERKVFPVLIKARNGLDNYECVCLVRASGKAEAIGKGQIWGQRNYPQNKGFHSLAVHVGNPDYIIDDPDAGYLINH